MKAEFIASQYHRIVGEALRPVASELRLVDVGEFVAFIRFECWGAISDLFDGAADLYFAPGVVRFADAASFDLDWAGEPTIRLDTMLRLSGITIFLRLVLEARTATVDVQWIEAPMALLCRENLEADVKHRLDRVSLTV
ncbi:hypothetical protein [Pararhizobium mangrovi]|uniref:Uncharacterized protein n=1 Tax=Pararhizobium mangrovi TaxID=2590452 RepID=A0A506TVN6_9HYPH|nr:hypothetical protein [Pararhizobium mangrovi]TPW26133.1 hypothetical protein FJU11_16030 [Pararhizobium mangrovi]